MKDVLCIYYSRTGHTKRAVMDIGGTLDAEIIRVFDNVDRKGWTGWLKCGLDAMRRDTAPISYAEPERPLEAYRLVIVATPVWAGRCSAPIRAFLKEHGKELGRVAYVITRASEGKRYEEVYRQMDLYLDEPHKAAASLQSESVGYHFWRDEFLRQVQEVLDGKN